MRSDVSSLTCIARNIGRALEAMNAMKAAMTGRITTSRRDRRVAHPQRHEDAAEHHHRRGDHQGQGHHQQHLHLLHVVRMRVMSDAVPNRLTSSCEKD